jgi:hypothetical protein
MSQPAEGREAFAKRLDLPIGLLEVANLYTVRGLPATFLINRHGRITALALGPRDWDSPAAHALMEILLK